MSFWKLIKALNFKQISSLLGKSLKHPLFMMATVSATLKTYRISQREFPNIHGKHNKANAFRHALWNALIAKKCARFSKNREVILSWTQNITDWHEEFAPNEPLAKEMDLHNNRLGREAYQQLSEKKVEEIVDFTKAQLNQAVLVKDIKEIPQYSTQLVYLED
jgi:hypothetical protein